MTRTPSDGEWPTALDGVRVLDVTQVMAGPFCAMQLCDHGRRRDQDRAARRRFDPPHGRRGRAPTAPAFNAVNRGKRGIVLNLKSPAGREAFLRLVATRRHPDRELPSRGDAKPRPRLRDAGRRSSRRSSTRRSPATARPGRTPAKGGFDLVAQGVTGLMSITGEPGGPPVKVGVPITDLGAALFAMSAILAALLYRTRTGRGQYIDTSLVDAGVAMSVWEATEYFSGQRHSAADGVGASDERAVPGDSLRRWLHHAGGCQRSAVSAAVRAARSARVADRSGLRGRHAAASGIARALARDDRSRHDDPAARRTGSRCSRRTVCRAVRSTTTSRCSPIRHIRARGLVVETDHPTLGRIPTLGAPVKMSLTPPIAGRPAPLLGQHTESSPARARLRRSANRRSDAAVDRKRLYHEGICSAVVIAAPSCLRGEAFATGPRCARPVRPSSRT